MRNLHRNLGTAIVAVVLTLEAGYFACAGGGYCCSHCGCQSECQKVCRLVEEEKKLTVVCWGAKCEDFCIPGRSQKCCEHCENLCTDSPDGECQCAHTRKTSWSIWKPWECPTLHTKTKLMKKTVTKKIPSYKWVVEDLCADCEAKATSADPQPGVEVPPKPKATDVKEAPKESKEKSKS